MFPQVFSFSHNLDRIIVIVDFQQLFYLVIYITDVFEIGLAGLFMHPEECEGLQSEGSGQQTNDLKVPKAKKL